MVFFWYYVMLLVFFPVRSSELFPFSGLSYSSILVTIGRASLVARSVQNLGPSFVIKVWGSKGWVLHGFSKKLQADEHPSIVYSEPLGYQMSACLHGPMEGTEVQTQKNYPSMITDIFGLWDIGKSLESIHYIMDFLIPMMCLLSLLWFFWTGMGWNRFQMGCQAFKQVKHPIENHSASIQLSFTTDQ